MSTTTVTAADIRPVDLFDEVDDEHLAAWAAAAELHEFAPDAILSAQGEPSPGLHLLLDGVAQAMRLSNGRIEPIGRNIAPTWMGAIASLTDAPVAVQMIAETTCRVATIPREEFERLVLATPPVYRRIMRQIVPVVNRIQSVEQNRERLASLGTMAAGLAHELNNPAAAARRTTDELTSAFEVLSTTLGRFVEAGVERADAEHVLRLRTEALERADARGPLDALDAADAEDVLLEKLEALGVEEPWRLTEPLAAAGVDDAWLAELGEHTGSATNAALAWVAASLTTRDLLGELNESVARLSNLVGAVKRYAYMDRGELNEVDVHEGLETTLIVLGHKLKHTSIEVVRDYDTSLPRMSLRGSEMNQVWTNLLHNAIDALGESGTITIRSRRDGPCVVVDIADDGPGIPEATIGRVFDPFFTTKDVGQGTGLGLDVARRIVEDRHNGSLWVDSEPGATTFHVRLPL